MAKVNNVNMNDLKALTKDLNDVLELEPELKVKVGMKKTDLIKEIKKVADLIEPGDAGKFKRASEKTFEALGIELPFTADDDDKAKPKGKDKKKDSGKDKARKPVGKKTGKKGPGVIATIQDLIMNKGPITKEKILKELVKKFPDREEKSMANTINVQLPNRMAKEKKIKIEKNDEGYFVK